MTDDRDSSEIADIVKEADWYTRVDANVGLAFHLARYWHKIRPVLIAVSAAEAPLDLGPCNRAFHNALRQFPDEQSFKALHHFWNEAFAGQPQSPAAEAPSDGAIYAAISQRDASPEEISALNEAINQAMDEDDLVVRLRAWHEDGYGPIFKEAADEIERLRGVSAAEAPSNIEEMLKDPNVVHINMLCGGIARPSWEHIKHLYPEQFRSPADAPPQGMPTAWRWKVSPAQLNWCYGEEYPPYTYACCIEPLYRAAASAAKAKTTDSK